MTGVDLPARRLHRMYGMDVSTSVVLPGVPPVSGSGKGVVTVDADTRAGIEARCGDREPGGVLSQGDGESIEVEMGRGGDILLRYSGGALFMVDAGGCAVHCAADRPAALDWRRVLLDTVLGTAALCCGREALHAAAVELPEGVAAIAGTSGGGKSTLCAELVRRGARLFTDDMVFLTRSENRILAHPGPPLMNLAQSRRDTGAAIGRVLGTLGDEIWVAVHDGSDSPAPLAVIVLLDRRADAVRDGVEVVTSPRELLALGLDSGPQRRRARFDLLADLGRRTPVVRLVAGLGTPAGTLAGMVESAVRRVATR